MKEEFILNPLLGIEYKGMAINFGMSVEEVKNICGEAPLKRRLYYFDNALAFDFDDDNKLEFIEFLGGEKGIPRPKIYGKYAFDLQANELVKLLTSHNGVEAQDDENGYSLGFLHISVGLYRSCTPLAIEESRQEMIADGCSAEEIEEYVAYEKEKSDYWECIGIGKQGYYK